AILYFLGGSIFAIIVAEMRFREAEFAMAIIVSILIMAVLTVFIFGTMAVFVDMRRVLNEINDRESAAEGSATAEPAPAPAAYEAGDAAVDSAED
ncbi:MAG: hypothetical protein V3R73_02855, partial [Sphingomonadales bacterium]